MEETIKAMDKITDFKPITVAEPMDPEQKDIKVFASMIRAAITGKDIFQVGDANITKGDNGALIPSTIANKIILMAENFSPIFARAEKYNVKGTLHIPYVAADDNHIEMAYAAEFSDLEAKNATFSSVDLTGFLAGVLCKISNSLINNSDFNVVNEVIRLMARAVAYFYEHETLIGTSGKATGISTATQVLTAAATNKVTADELIELQDTLKSAYQGNACWIMAPATLTEIRKLKYGNGEYILQPDLRDGFGYALLGKPVFTSDQAPALDAGNKAIVYGDFEQALAVKLVEDFEIQVLREKYATQHATGLVGWTEFDSKIQNDQAVAVLQMKA